MALLGLLQAGGSVLGQAMEQMTGGSLLSMLLISCAFTLSLVYLLRLAIGHLVPLPSGAVRAPPGFWEGDPGTQEAEGLAGTVTAGVLSWVWRWAYRSSRGSLHSPSPTVLGNDGLYSGGGRVSGPGRGRACRLCGHSDSAGRGTGGPNGVALSALKAGLGATGVLRAWWGPRWGPRWRCFW